MKRDIRKIMALLSQAEAKKSEVPIAIEKRDIDIPFLVKDGTVCRRSIRIYLPETVPRPMPVVFVAHYEMTETDSALAMYLTKGWAVSTIINYTPEYNGKLVDDDMIFNSAALTVVRKQPEIDRTRIAVCGGSAGGYMTLMLSILHLGICCSISFSGITNLLFSMKHYSLAANSYNKKALTELTKEEQKDVERCMEAMPLPILGSVIEQFSPILANILDARDPSGEIWTDFSPSCMTNCFTNPILLTHFTSDVLVPIDQLTKRYTYTKPGESLPEGFRHRMSEFPLPEKLQHSLAEALPIGDMAEKLYPSPESSGENIVVPFDITKRFNIVVFDEGVVEADAGHQKKLDIGTTDTTAYIEAQFTRTYRETNWLTAGKLILMAERYAGKCVLIPGQADIDDTVYGSLAMERQVVLEELSEFTGDYIAQLEAAFRDAVEIRSDLTEVLGEIKSQLFS